MKRKLGALFTIYALSIGVADTALFQLNQISLIPPVDILIVGVHFVPFARLFKTWQYYITSVVTVAVVIATLATTSASVTIGGLAAWTVLPFIGDAAALWFTAALMLIQGKQALSANAKRTLVGETEKHS